jgi:hypothetical protein
MRGKVERVVKLREGGAGEAVGLQEISHDLSPVRGRGTRKGNDLGKYKALEATKTSQDLDSLAQNGQPPVSTVLCPNL